MFRPSRQVTGFIPITEQRKPEPYILLKTFFRVAVCHFSLDRTRHVSSRAVCVPRLVIRSGLRRSLKTGARSPLAGHSRGCASRVNNLIRVTTAAHRQQQDKKGSYRGSADSWREKHDSHFYLPFVTTAPGQPCPRGFAMQS